MNYENFKKGFDKPTIITAQQYGTKVSVELDHSDTDIDELFDAFETLVIGLGYHPDSWKQWIMDRADEYREEEFDKNFSFEFPQSYTAEDFKKDEERYRATQEDEAEFDDYGARIVTDSSFEWGDEPEEDNLFEGDEWKANDKLKAANERYKNEVKKINTKKRKAKSVKEWEDEIDLGGNE